MSDRFLKNKNLINASEQDILAQKRCVIIGCGGLGEYSAMMLTRLGVGHLTLVDDDFFIESNLNRQLFSTEGNLNKSKTEVTRDRLMEINSQVTVDAKICRLTADNGREILSGHDILIDAVDSISTRLMLQELGRDLGIPLISGSIAGWYGQITFVMPGDETLTRIYQNKKANPIETKLGNPAFTPALVASWQVAEVVKFLLNKGELLRNKLLFINLLENEVDLVDLTPH